MLEFDRYYARRVREETKAALVNEVNAAELGIYLELDDEPCTSAWLQWRLDLDPGYLSRTLDLMELKRGITTGSTGHDKRMRQIALTPLGRAIARSLRRFQEERVRGLMEKLPRREQRRLIQAMGAIQSLLERVRIS